MHEILDWLNENQYRGYPLRENTPRSIGNTDFILDNIILDASFQYVETNMPTEVKLESITISGNTVTIVITDQTAFTFNKNTVTYPNYMRNLGSSLLVVGEAIKDIPDDVYTFTSTVFEDSVSSQMQGAWRGVNSIGFNTSVPISSYINLIEGFQFGIRIKANNTLSLTADSNAGKPISTQQFYPSIVDDCENIISSISSVGVTSNPDVFHISPSSNTVVYDDPPNHRIFIGLNFDQTDVCTK